MPRRGDPGQRREISEQEAVGTPSEDLREAARTSAGGGDASEEDPDEERGRIASTVQNVARRVRQRAAKQRAMEGSEELKEAAEQRRQEQSGGIITKVFGEDAGREVQSLIEETGVPDGEEFGSRLDLDHDGDGETLAQELGVEGLEASRGDVASQPLADTQVERDLQALGQAGPDNGRTRGFDQQLDDDLEALGAVGESRDIDTEL